eukprot:jgi/Chrzof1/3108/Cz12g12090.t1
MQYVDAVQQLLKALESLPYEHLSNGSVLILLGPSPLRPKEVYKITLPSNITTGNSLAGEVNPGYVAICTGSYLRTNALFLECLIPLLASDTHGYCCRACPPAAAAAAHGCQGAE